MEDPIEVLRQAQEATRAASEKWRLSGWRLGVKLTDEQQALKDAYNQAVDAELAAREAAIAWQNSFVDPEGDEDFQ